MSQVQSVSPKFYNWMLEKASDEELKNMSYSQLTMIYLAEFARYIRDHSLYPLPNVLEIASFLDHARGRANQEGPKVSSSQVTGILRNLEFEGLIYRDQHGEKATSRTKFLVFINDQVIEEVLDEPKTVTG